MSHQVKNDGNPRAIWRGGRGMGREGHRGRGRGEFANRGGRGGYSGLAQDWSSNSHSSPSHNTDTDGAYTTDPTSASSPSSEQNGFSPGRGTYRGRAKFNSRGRGSGNPTDTDLRSQSSSSPTRFSPNNWPSDRGHPNGRGGNGGQRGRGGLSGANGAENLWNNNAPATYDDRFSTDARGGRGSAQRGRGGRIGGNSGQENLWNNNAQATYDNEFSPRGHAGRGRGWSQRGRGEGWADRGGRGRGRGQVGERGGFGPEREYTTIWADRGNRGGRGLGRGRGQGRTNGSREYEEETLPPPRELMENLLLPAIAELNIPTSEATDKPAALDDFRCIGSYTWSKVRNPTIIVPGSPREWLDRPLPFRVPFDNGIRMFHEDAYHMGTQSALLPLFRAVDTLASAGPAGTEGAEDVDKVDWASVNFVTDRNNLRKLLRWIRNATDPADPTIPTANPTSTTEPLPAQSDMSEPTSPISPTSSDGAQVEGGSAFSPANSWDPRQDFRIDLDLGGANTVLMHRFATSAREKVIPPKAGCRSNFERQSMKAAPGCEDGEGYYRIVQYNLGGLKMVVRFEVDACIADPGKSGPAELDSSDDAKAGDNLWGGYSAQAGKNNMSEGSPARQSFTSTDEGGTWGSNNLANGVDWGVTEIAQSEQRGEGAPEEPSVNQWEVKEDSSDNPWEVKEDSSDNPWEVKEDSSNNPWEVKEDPSNNPWDVNDNPSASASTPNATHNSKLVTIQDLTIVRAGKWLPQSAILELATRSAKFADSTNVVDTFLQLFLTQTPTHFLAVHQSGTFEKVVRQELDSQEFARIAEAEEIRRNVAQFVDLLKEIQKLVKEHGDTGRVSLVCEKGKLRLFGRMGEDGRVPVEELERFKGEV